MKMTNTVTLKNLQLLAKQCLETSRAIEIYLKLKREGHVTNSGEDSLQAVLLRQETITIKVRQGQASVEDLQKAGGCPTCQIKGMKPDHDGSARCESGSIASGGNKSHCSCDICF